MEQEIVYVHKSTGIAFDPELVRSHLIQKKGMTREKAKQHIMAGLDPLPENYIPVVDGLWMTEWAIARSGMASKLSAT